MPVPQIFVDFADTSDDTLIPAVYDSGDLEAQCAVLLRDHDGNTCYGVVDSLGDNGVVWVLPRWDTWVPAGFVPTPADNAVRLRVVFTVLNDARSRSSATHVNPAGTRVVTVGGGH
jgi:hypothetical protein